MAVNGRDFTTADIISFSPKEMKDFLSEVDLLSVDFEVKIGDLGFSKYLPDTQMPSRTMCGTPLYMSPQIVFRQDYSFKCDIWSLGALYFELLTGVTPFESKNMKQLEKEMKQGTIRLKIHQIPSVESLHILSSCLTLEEKERISIAELLAHPFIDLSNKTTPIFTTESEGKLGRQMTCRKIQNKN